MQIISPANETVRSILKNIQNPPSADSRLLHYCVECPVEEGTLLFNLLTRELVLLSPAEYENRFRSEDLRRRWFVVSQDTNDREYADLVKWVLASRAKKPTDITGYTIFPTTDCNARCFYCFELGRSRIPMTQETAQKTVQYIKAHCGGNQVHISWFGGEPLFNPSAIDTICDGLRRESIPFSSTMVSNGYLMDENTVRKAVAQWNLKRIQVTLDGTEQVYNRAKAYIYRKGSPYQVVLANIGHLLDAGVPVQIRLNMDLYNAEDLLALVEELARRFPGRKGLRVYAHHLFDGDKPMAEIHTEEEWIQRDTAMCRLEEAIARHGLAGRRGIRKNLRLNHCMADSGRSVTILPDGNIGLCEHFSETEFAGHLDRAELDPAMVASWREISPEIPECAACFFYPECIKLKKCASGRVCFAQLRQEQLRRTKREMTGEYQNWRADEAPEEEDGADNC